MLTVQSEDWRGNALVGMQAADVHDKYIIRALRLSLRALPSPFLTSCAPSSARMSAAILHSAEHYSEDENIFAFLPPSLTTAGPRRAADQPAHSQPGDSQQQCALPTTTVAANIAFLSPTLEPIPTTAVSSNDVRAHLHGREDSDSEPRSRPVTGAGGESIVSVPRSTAGGAACKFSEDVDKTVLEDTRVRAPSSREGSIK